MPQVTREDLDTAIVRTMDGDELRLVSWDYLAGMAGFNDNMCAYDPDAVCQNCDVSDWTELWRWFSVNGTEDTGNWECTYCILKDANSDSCPDSWYILAR